jgi:hypothetical protein
MLNTTLRGLAVAAILKSIALTVLVVAAILVVSALLLRRVPPEDKGRALRRIAGGAVIAVETYFVAWVALFLLLFSAWFLDDSLAAKLSSSGWYSLALQRLAVVLVMAVAAACLAFLVNALVVPRLLPKPRLLALYLSLAYGQLIAVAGLAGCIYFVIARPYM